MVFHNVKKNIYGNLYYLTCKNEEQKTHVLSSDFDYHYLIYFMLFYSATIYHKEHTFKNTV